MTSKTFATAAFPAVNTSTSIYQQTLLSQLTVVIDETRVVCVLIVRPRQLQEAAQAVELVLALEHDAGVDEWLH